MTSPYSRSSGPPWSLVEVAATVKDYFDMLEAEVRGRSYSKAAHRRELLKHLDARSEASVEFKHRNISAVLDEMGLRYIQGYRPLRNLQSSLIEAVDHEFLGRPELRIPVGLGEG